MTSHVVLCTHSQTTKGMKMEISKSRFLECGIITAHLEAVDAVSKVKDEFYKLASAYFHEGEQEKKKAAYAASDKYQAVINALLELEYEINNVRDAGDTIVDGWGSDD